TLVHCHQPDRKLVEWYSHQHLNSESCLCRSTSGATESLLGCVPVSRCPLRLLYASSHGDREPPPVRPHRHNRVKRGRMHSAQEIHHAQFQFRQSHLAALARSIPASPLCLADIEYSA